MRVVVFDDEGRSLYMVERHGDAFSFSIEPGTMRSALPLLERALLWAHKLEAQLEPLAVVAVAGPQ